MAADTISLVYTTINTLQLVRKFNICVLMQHMSLAHELDRLRESGSI